MDKELVVLVEEAPEGGFTAKALGAALFTEGDTFEEVEANVRDAVLCHFEEAERPRVVRLHFVRDHVIAV
ncbi:MAG: 2-oxoisovalerate dehydrogenase [Acidobacteria bacterium]|nr:MAG: 2-oxoisovalerate dehydrogenase [Acidobacteriota bacterium]RLE33919.1 MAG: 2-oxoisovalerate dehydrogenase [Acidobacteriota bacterium]